MPPPRAWGRSVHAGWCVAEPEAEAGSVESLAVSVGGADLCDTTSHATHYVAVRGPTSVGLICARAVRLHVRGACEAQHSNSDGKPLCQNTSWHGVCVCVCVCVRGVCVCVCVCVAVGCFLLSHCTPEFGLVLVC